MRFLGERDWGESGWLRGILKGWCNSLACAPLIHNSMAESLFEQEGLDCLIGEEDLVPFAECASIHSISTGADTQATGDEESFLPGTEEFRKARKRRQNRESAARNRARKRTEVTDLETEIQKLIALNQSLKRENASLRSENQILKGEQGFKAVLDEAAPKKKQKTSIGPLATVVMVSLVCVCLFMQSSTPTAQYEGLRMLTVGSDYESTYGYKPLLFLALSVAGVFFWLRKEPAVGHKGVIV